MSNGPIVSQARSTIGASAAPEAHAPAAEEAAPATEAASEASQAPETPAPQPSGAAPVAETAPEEAPEKHLELSKRFEAAAKREANVRRLESQWQEKLSGLSEKEKAIQAKLDELDEALGDPVGYLLKKGKDPVEVAKRFAKPESEEEKRIRKLEEALAAKTAQEEQEKERIAAEQQDRRRFEAMKMFVGSITPDNAPNLTLVYEPHQVPALVEELLHRPVDDGTGRTIPLIRKFNIEHGRNPSDDEIREALELEAQPRATRILEGHAKRSSQPTNGQAQQAPAQTESGPNGISNQHAAATSSGKKKALSLEERRRQAREAIVAGLEAGQPSRE
jgi:hypothetical protein